MPLCPFPKSRTRGRPCSADMSTPIRPGASPGQAHGAIRTHHTAGRWHHCRGQAGRPLHPSSQQHPCTRHRGVNMSPFYTRGARLREAKSPAQVSPRWAGHLAASPQPQDLCRLLPAERPARCGTVPRPTSHLGLFSSGKPLGEKPVSSVAWTQATNSDVLRINKT